MYTPQLIERLYDLADSLTENKIDKFNAACFLRNTAMRIEAWPSPWIAIKDRKPTKADYYVNFRTFESRVLLVRHKDGSVWISNPETLESLHPYTHWMPIPPLPKDLHQSTAAPETPLPQTESSTSRHALRMEIWTAAYKSQETKNTQGFFGISSSPAEAGDRALREFDERFPGSAA